MKIVPILFSLLCFTFCLVSCSQDQLDRTARDAQYVKNLTTQPSVQLVAAAANPLTGGIAGDVVGVIGLGASLVLNLSQMLSHASTKKTLAVTQTMLAAGVAVTAPVLEEPAVSKKSSSVTK